MDGDMAAHLVEIEHMKKPTTIEVEIVQNIAHIWLDGEENRNALSISTMIELDSELQNLEKNTSIPVVLIRGRGPSFCAGFDLKPVLKDSDRLNDFIRVLGKLLKRIRQHRAVIIAGVEGAAIAGGCAIVSACDLIVASPHAQLGYPVHQLGISPVVSAHTLIAGVGIGSARSLMLSGSLVDGNQAFKMGLATMLDDSPIHASEKLARRVASHGHRALEVTKSWLNELEQSQIEARFDEPIDGSASLANDDESMMLLRTRWGRR